MPHKDQPTFKCVQTETLEELLNKYNDNQARMDSFYTGFSQRDERIKYAFDEVNKSITNLTNGLEERKLINNFNKEEKKWLKERVDNIGTKTEDADKALYDRTTALEKAVVAIGKNDENQDKSINKLEKLLYLAIGLIVSFFITFGYKTLFMGM
jgi:23S rRNA maturation mini-RNase III